MLSKHKIIRIFNIFLASLIILAGIFNLNLNVISAPEDNSPANLKITNNSDSKYLGMVFCNGENQFSNDPTTGLNTFRYILKGETLEIPFQTQPQEFIDNIKTSTIYTFDFFASDIEFLLTSNNPVIGNSANFCKMASRSEIKTNSYKLYNYLGKTINETQVQKNLDFNTKATVSSLFDPQPSLEKSKGGIEFQAYLGSQICLNNNLINVSGNNNLTPGIYKVKSLIKQPGLYPYEYYQTCDSSINSNKEGELEVKDGYITQVMLNQLSLPGSQYNYKFGSYQANPSTGSYLDVGDITYANITKRPPVICINGQKVIEKYSGGGKFPVFAGLVRFALPSTIDNSCSDQYGFLDLNIASDQSYQIYQQSYSFLSEDKYDITFKKIDNQKNYLSIYRANNGWQVPLTKVCVNGKLKTSGVVEITPGAWVVSFPTENGSSCKENNSKYIVNAGANLDYSLIYYFDFSVSNKVVTTNPNSQTSLPSSMITVRTGGYQFSVMTVFLAIVLIALLGLGYFGKDQNQE